ncbi:MAG: MogA/MoaB family molybdenum cofactor biosynthesis protein [Oscillospiraceae bacterium]
MRVAIITSSDSGYEGKREDKSAPVIEKLVTDAGYIVVHKIVLPDEIEMLKAEMIRICDENIADLILTTGGTGFSQRDVMPEATCAVSNKNVPGIPEAMRFYSMQFTKRAMLSRAAAGIRKNTLIINMPGSPKAVGECLEYILPELSHGLEILLGEAKDCARK